MSFIHPDDSKLDHTLDPPPLPIHEQEGRTWNVWTYTHWWIHTLETLGRWLFHMNCLFLMIIVLLSVAHRTTFWASFEKKKKKNAEKLKIPHYFFHIYISEKACIHFISVYSLSIQLVFPYICSFVSLPPFVVVLDLSLSILLPHSASVWYVFCAWDFNSYIDEYLLLFLIKLRPPPLLELNSPAFRLSPYPFMH